VTEYAGRARLRAHLLLGVALVGRCAGAGKTDAQAILVLREGAAVETDGSAQPLGYKCFVALTATQRRAGNACYDP
jgi:hypothetical protein